MLQKTKMTVLERTRSTESPTDKRSSPSTTAAATTTTASSLSTMMTSIAAAQHAAAAQVAAQAAQQAAAAAQQDRYITPDYLSPLSTASSTDKSGKSPLQMLALTCSQIGADTGSNKLLAEKSNNNNNSSSSRSKSRSPNLIVSDNTTTTATRPVSFKPYENGKKSPAKPSSVISLSPTRASKTPRSSSSTPPKTKTPSPSAATKAPTPSSSSSNPVIRSGLEVLANKSLPPGLDNPALRPALGHAHHHLGGGLPCRDPYCRDLTCPLGIYNVQMSAALAAAGSSLPPGYAELLHAQKLGLGLPAATAATTLPPTTSTAAPSALAGPGGPYICNWMNGREGYCGKRHNSAEELLQHLRTHTNLSTSDSAATAALLSSTSPAAASSSAVAAAAASLYPPGGGLFSNLHRSFGGGSSALSSLAAASRFHPYAKPGGSLSASGGLPPSLAALGTGIPPFPPSLAGLGAAYSNPASLYALYGSRLAGGSLP